MTVHVYDVVHQVTQLQTDSTMTQEHPITPPPELLQEWCKQGHNCISELDALKELATQAACWGADQELEACLQWFSAFYCMETWMQKDLEKFRTARRPKPPSLKEQALEEVGVFEGMGTCNIDIIRRALESLPE